MFLLGSILKWNTIELHDSFKWTDWGEKTRMKEKMKKLKIDPKLNFSLAVLSFRAGMQVVLVKEKKIELWKLLLFFTSSR